ncbi:probable E3 ubiquitin-protein ligase RNF217 isoform X1 [Takifugu flavidus]|uniref:E3 ubiquitin-protein ligase RNF217 n=1 Tax=Takifugu flavidus TaxID=433684 RepID=A0A5C6NQY4_9TELE|nr:probable E3 ubiquitin-protein ligase RNF217 isoform X1 [Takifugu flavidus]TWW69001.1 putative E3 ubiquitin-protein ligase RNF217 [Takifugu flavidus]
MGRAISGMEDAEPTTEMPSFISSFEEGRTKLSGKLSKETYFPDSKVERAGGDLDSGVTAPNFPLSPDGSERESGDRRSEGEKDERSTVATDNNGGEAERRSASVVEILRRNLGVSKSPSLRVNFNGWGQLDIEHENSEGTINNDITDGFDSERGCKKSDGGTAEAVTENEATLAGLTSDAQAVEFEFLHLTDPCRHKRDTDSNKAALDESVGTKEHIYCTVYCIDNDREQNQIPHDALATSYASEIEQDVGSNLEMYTTDDLVDPFGEMAHHLSGVQAGGETAVRGCRVCLEGKSIAPLPCCRKAVCNECLGLYVSSQVRLAKSHINCPIYECRGYLEEGVVISNLSKEDAEKYHYFLELSQLDSSTKPCPQCSQFTTLREHNSNRSEHKYKIQCSNCQFLWCFKCHAPWHNGLKCRQYRKGDKLLRTWASVIEHGQRNAQKCPQCKIHIQRTEGCDHMTCTQCSTNFCYRCGERYRHLRFFGDHTSNLSVFGCKYRYLPDKPHLRRFIRGSVCATKLLIAPVVLLLVVVVGALALVIGLVLFPVYYVCKRRKKQRTQGSRRWP